MHREKNKAEKESNACTTCTYILFHGVSLDPKVAFLCSYIVQHHYSFIKNNLERARHSLLHSFQSVQDIAGRLYTTPGVSLFVGIYTNIKKMVILTPIHTFHSHIDMNMD